AWNDLSISERLNFTNSLAEMIQGENHKIAVDICSQLIEEFTCNFNSSKIQLSWEFHFHAKKSFQNESLLILFQACLLYLNNIVSDPLKISDSNLSSLVAIEKILHWNFIKEDSAIRTFFDNVILDAISQHEGAGDSLEHKN
ncbi:hypothetical protein BB560_004103, partial [Smittium megazygosporum]